MANAFYHATLRGNHRQNIFRDEADRYLLNAIVERSLARYDARIHAYCWMTNHLHLLVQVGDEPLGSLMRQVASGYARAFQMKLETTGHLFERRYFARMVAADAYLLAVLRYIHLNPIQAGMCASAADHPWSSHSAYAGGPAPPWLTTDFALAMFSEERVAACASYRQFIAAGDPGWSPEDDAVSTPLDIQPLARPEIWRPNPKPSQTLEELAMEACAIFAVTPADVLSIRRDHALVLTRGWIGREAVARRVASLSAVARFLGRDRATLRHAMGQLEPRGAQSIAE